MLTFRGVKNVLKMVKQDPQENVATVGGMLDSYGVFELCRPAPLQPPCFALKIKGKPTGYVNEVEDVNHGRTYKPIKKVPWPLPEEPTSYETEQQLFDEIRSCIYNHLDLPNENDYTILTAWVMATWLQERWISYPFLNLFGAMEAGKSRANEILGRLAFRGWNATFVSSASLYRVCDQWHPVLLLDETEAMLKQQDIVGLLNASYRKGSTVPRQQQKDDGGFETEFYELHGFRVLAGTRELPQTLKSRSIVFHMRKAVRPIKMFIDEKRCTTIRNKLLQYRFNKMLAGHAGHAGAYSEVGLGELEEIAQKMGSSRLAEIFHPLISVAPNQQIKNSLIEYAINLNKERNEELSSSDESITLTAILKMHTLNKMSKGLILIKDIANEINSNLSYNEQWSYRKVGSLCSRLGFKKATNHDKLTCIKWDQKLINELKKDSRYAACFITESSQTLDSKDSYGTTTEQVPPTPETSPASPASPPLEDYLLDKSRQIKIN